MKKFKHEGNTPQKTIQLEDVTKYKPVPQFHTHYNGVPTQGEINLLPSKTIPDQTMSLREILYKYAHGLPIDSDKVPVYNGDMELPNFKTMDHSEVYDFIQQQKQFINDYRKAESDKEKKRVDIDMEKFYREKFQKEQADLEKAAQSSSVSDSIPKPNKG